MCLDNVVVCREFPFLLATRRFALIDVITDKPLLYQILNLRQYLFQLLEDAGDPNGGVILLVSDGGENEIPKMNEVKPDIIAKGVIINAILISEAADKGLIELAAATGGKAFFDSGSFDSTDLQSALRSIVSEDDGSLPGVAPVEVS